MKNLLLNITEKLLIPALAVLVITGLGKVFYELITDPTQFNNVTWGIFDTLGD